MAEVTAPQEWTEVYAASGIAPNTAIYLQNKGNFEVYVFAGSEPAAGSRVGWMLLTGDVVQIETGEPEEVPSVAEILGHVVTSVREGGDPYQHWLDALAANGLTVVNNEESP